MSPRPTIDRLRNVGILAHVDSGKTTTTERLLAAAAVVRDEATVAPDDRGISITAIATACDWRGATISLVEGPGNLALTAEIDRTMRVLDGAIVLVDASTGVDATSVAMLAHASRNAVSSLAVVNKMDRAGADFAQAVSGLEAAGGAPLVTLQLPIGAGRDFAGLVDLVSMTAVTWKAGSFGGLSVAGAVPAAMAADAAAARARLLAALGLAEGVAVDVLKAAIRRGVIARSIVPVLALSAFHNRGIAQLLDAVVDYLPAPSDRAPLGAWALPSGEAVACVPSNDAPFAALVFRAMNDPFLGALTFARVFSGTVSVGREIANAGRGSVETPSRIVRMRADTRDELTEAQAGDVVALGGLRAVAVGDTLSDASHLVVFERADTATGDQSSIHAQSPAGAASGAPRARTA